MRTFITGHKVNFVDDNNVFVGFDNWQSCCENFGYSLRTILPATREEAEDSTWHLPTDGFNFDPAFFKDGGLGDFYDGGAVAFRLVNPAGIEVFLTLYNAHNGYYSHGFEATVGGIAWQEGCI